MQADSVLQDSISIESSRSLAFHLRTENEAQSSALIDTIIEGQNNASEFPDSEGLQVDHLLTRSMTNFLAGEPNEFDFL